MRPAVQLLLTVLLVAGGLVVYDTVFVRDPALPPETSFRSEREARPSDEEPPVPFAVLEGTGDDLWRAAVDRRLAELEVRGGGAPASGLPDPRAPIDVPGAVPSDPGGAGDGGEAAAPGDETEGSPRPVSREEFVHFRRMLEAVERQRKLEAEAKRVNDFLDKVGVQLKDEERRELIRTHLGFTARWRQIARQPAEDDQAKEQRREAQVALYAEYERAVRDRIPATEADIFLNAIRDAVARSREGEGR